MGYSIRTVDWRLTMWLPFDNADYVAQWDQEPIAVELYDHRNSSDFDFDDDGEVMNVAQDPANADIITKLVKELQRQYSWSPNWLSQCRSNMNKRQLQYDE